jgi:hypothetical protein
VFFALFLFRWQCAEEEILVDFVVAPQVAVLGSIPELTARA